MAKRYVNSADLTFDDHTGALLVKLSEAVQVQVENLAAAVTGAKNADCVVSQAAAATIDATAKTLPTAFGITVPDTAVRIVLIPRGTVYYKFGSGASANDLLLPSGGLSLPITKAVADTITLYASNVPCDLLVCTPRN